jgi:N-acetylmuramoyl-L-alanine amidase
MNLAWLTRVLIVIFFVPAGGIYAKKNNQKTDSPKTGIHRIFHHMMFDKPTGTGGPGVEFGQVVLYFSHEPLVQRIPRIPSSAQKDQQLELFFPGASVKNLDKDELEKKMLNPATKQPFYVVKLKPTSTPIPGVFCYITFDPQLVVVDYDTFLSISGQHAMRIRFFNKALLTKIGKERALLRVASIEPRIVLDCGHGGNDVGAVGIGGLFEKEITLSIGLEVARLLRECGFEVYLTRDRDIEVPLDTRTSYANAISDATALISIHANSSVNPLARGIETFHAGLSLFKRKDSLVESSYRPFIDQYQQKLDRASLQLAGMVHHHVMQWVQQQQTVVDRCVKAAAAQVLVGTCMPAALIEIGFLSNSYEATLLSDKRYQQQVAQGICNGIIAYHAAIFTFNAI